MKPVFVALDTPDLERASSLADAARSGGCGVKLGLEFFCANGPGGVERVARLGVPVFLDLKLHDIPNTVARAVEALRPLQPAVLTVHAAGGLAMLQAASQAAGEGTKVVGVTVLTSLDAADLDGVGVTATPAEQVERLAALARRAGLDGIVCSGNEVSAASQAWPGGYFVVPGVRPEGSATADQKRVVTPRAALQSGASVLVVGRPVTGAADPAAALEAIVESL